LEIIFTQVQGEFRRGASNDQRTLARQGYVNPIMVLVDARYLSPLLDELRQRRRQSGKHPSGNANVSNTTNVLMLLQVGESVEVEPISHGALTSLRRTARKRMNNEYAVWHRTTLPSGLVQITRMPDGTPAAAKYAHPIIGLLAGIRLNHYMDIDVPKDAKRAFHDAQAHSARKLILQPHARWSARRISPTKFRVRRVA
jgi:hypothetical protein